MADTVSLNEITSLKGDAENAFGGIAGGDAAVLPFSQGIAYLSHAADQKNEADKFKYQEFNKNMNDFLTHFDATDITGLSPADEKIIGDKYAQVAKDIADNISIVKNPNSDPAKYSQLKQGEAELQKMIAASKAHKSFDDNTTAFTKANPDWHDVNKNTILGSQSTPTDNWKPYTLEMPIAYSPEAIAKIVAPIAEQKYAEATQYKGYISEEEGIRYRKQAWDDGWRIVHATTTASGQSLMDNAEKAWAKLKPDQRMGSFQNWFNAARDGLMPQNQVTKKTITADPLTEARERNLLTAAEGAADRKNRYAIALLNLEKDKKITIDDGRIYNEFLGAFKTGKYSPKELQNLYGDNSKVTIKAGTKIVDSKTQQETTTTTETEVPRFMITGSRSDANGNLIVTGIDYSKPTSKTINGLGNKINIPGSEYLPQDLPPVEFERFRTDAYRMFGDKHVTDLAKKAEDYRLKHGMGINPDKEVEYQFFYGKSKPEAVPAVQPGITPQTKKGKDGKIYSSTDGVTWVAPDGTVVKLH